MIYHRIPTEIHEDIIEVMDYVQPLLPFAPEKETAYLFEVYNSYIKPTYKDDIEPNCPACMTRVFGAIRTIVNGWKQQKENLSK